ncbi:MCP four helix bundle domain-containing protein [Marinilabiliaceae bacterium ANBcel2]|nr:MCP four helix bundle domain-containing protein [Marinilabiliaceae bacterium ANBcel2]
MRFKDLKVGQKIISGFALVGAVALIVGVVALVSLRNVGNSFHQVADVNMPSIRYLQDVETNAEALMVGLRTTLNPNLDRDEMNQMLRDVQNARAAYNNSIDEYEDLPRSD